MNRIIRLYPVTAILIGMLASAGTSLAFPISPPNKPTGPPALDGGWYKDLVHDEGGIASSPVYVFDNLPRAAWLTFIDSNWVLSDDTVFDDGDTSFDSNDLWRVYDNGELIITTSKDPVSYTFGDEPFFDFQLQDDRTPKGRAMLEAGYHEISFEWLWQGDGVESSPAGFYTRLDIVTPVPAAVWLLGSGLIGLAGLRRRSRG